MLIAAAAAAATKTTTATAVKPPMMPAATVAPAAVSPMLTRSPSLQSTSVATGQPQVVADPSSICKLQAGKTTTSFWGIKKWNTFFSLDSWLHNMSFNCFNLLSRSPHCQAALPSTLPRETSWQVSMIADAYMMCWSLFLGTFLYSFKLLRFKLPCVDVWYHNIHSFSSIFCTFYFFLVSWV